MDADNDFGRLGWLLFGTTEQDLAAFAVAQSPKRGLDVRFSARDRLTADWTIDIAAERDFRGRVVFVAVWAVHRLSVRWIGAC